MHTRLLQHVRVVVACLAAFLCLGSVGLPVYAQDQQLLQKTVSVDIAPQQLSNALLALGKQAGIQVMTPAQTVDGLTTQGAHGQMPLRDALSHLLEGTALGFHAAGDNTIGIDSAAAVKEREAAPHPGMTADADPTAGGDVKDVQAGGTDVAETKADQPATEEAAASSSSSHKLETVVVVAQKHGENLQNVPIAVTALSQEQLTSRQIAGGPDLVKSVPNLTFSKTNFTGYNIQIRGIGTQAVSVTVDPAVAVEFNGLPFIRNHFFEQEFYDVGQVEVLRGPQGTLYGRNATAGVVNLLSAKPTDRYEAMGSADVGNYSNHRFEAMLNLPLIDHRLDLRMAGEWTIRNGYSFNEQTNEPIDGRDLWSGRVSLLFHPLEDVSSTFIYEHFNESDDRLRSSKQLCTRDPGPSVVDGPAGLQIPNSGALNSGNGINAGAAWLTQGCKPDSLYGPQAFQAPNAGANPFIASLQYLAGALMIPGLDPYAGLAQSQSLRVIDSLLEPKYTANNDTFEFNVDYNISSELTLSSLTGYNHDSLYSTEDYNRYNSAGGVFIPGGSGSSLTSDSANGGSNQGPIIGTDGEFCDPQLGCSNRLVGEDVSQEGAEQFSQELRLASHFTGPFNYTVGANLLHYQTVENYYVFNNAITLLSEYINGGEGGYTSSVPALPHIPFDAISANYCGPKQSTYPPPTFTSGAFGSGCGYIDPNPLSQIDGKGHNYFRSQNPYHLKSYAGFGETYYQATPDLKLTFGLRATEDKKSFIEIPSQTALEGEGYPSGGTLVQDWKRWTGRLVASWTPKLDFTDQSLFYASYSRGYKGGGANPPGVFAFSFASPSVALHPLAFQPEHVNAFELGTKDTLLDGSLQLNATAFAYRYTNYQISQIVDRTAVTSGYDASVFGAELESIWEPIKHLRMNLALGYENGTLDKNQQIIDTMDRTDGNSDWMVVKPDVFETSNCILPKAAVNEMLTGYGLLSSCVFAYSNGWDPVTQQPYVPNPAGHPGYSGFDPATAPNSGAGFNKNIGGNKLPNMPPVTVSYGTQYSMPLSETWVATVRGDFYWQANSWARVYNDNPYDRIRGYDTLNLTLIFDNIDKWQAMFYIKNVLDTTAITGAFLNSDDSGLTTNIFVTDPRLYGLRLTKRF